jgi:hypothetical protein
MRVRAALILVLSLAGRFTSVGAAATDQFELQTQCGKLAGEYFSTEYGNGIYNNDFVDPDTRKTLYDKTRYIFVNHYNVNEDKCFVVITSRNITNFEKIENLAIWIMIIDLSEHRTIGMLHYLNEGAHADVCFVGPQDCHSMNEWELLLRPYMRD